jgi:hypothetical protein
VQRVLPAINMPPPAITEPVGTPRADRGETIDLDMRAAIPLNESPPVESSGILSFDSNELSEIRADQLVSHSFVYNISSLEPAAPSRVGREPAPAEVEEPPEHTGPQASWDGGTDKKPQDDSQSEGDDVEGSILISDSRMVKPVHDIPAAATDSLEVARARREAQERTPTVLTREELQQHEATIQPDEWAAAEMRRVATLSEAPAIEEELPEPEPVQEPNGSVDLLASSSSEINAADLMTGSSLPSQIDDLQLATNDLDNTQSAQFGEMVSSYPDVGTYPPNEDVSALRTIATGERASSLLGSENVLAIDQPTGGLTDGGATPDLSSIRAKTGFEEVTPYSPLTEKKAPLPRVEVSTSGIDPKSAAVVSDVEFDAMIDELKDITSSGFGEEEEMTENGGDSRALPVKRAKIMQDAKRQRRLR